MDSGNSGSMQSSSGGDEEFDSRAESISAFLSNNNNSNPLSHVAGSMSNPSPHPPPPTSYMFDPLSNYFDPLSRSPAPPLTNPNSLLNVDIVWSKSLRSDPNCTDLGGGFISTSSPTQQLFTNQTQSRTGFTSPQVIPGIESAGPRGSGSVDQTHNNTPRNPKKRSRASRRAPTTVLTTDTNNFRAMVQEFTGIPAPPFTSSPFSRTRLDLFGSASALRSVTSHLDPSPPPPPPPPYLLRPFAQKLQPPLAPSQITPCFLSSSPSIIDAIASTTTTTATGTSSNTACTTASSNSPTSFNYQLPQPQNNLFNINMQNPMLNFHPLLQSTPPKYPLSNSAILGTTKPQQQGSTLDLPSNVSHLKMGGLEDFGLSHGHVNTSLTSLQNMVSPSSETSSLRRSDSNSQNWADGGDHQALLRSINGNSVTNGKAHFSISSSDFHGDKPPENLGARSEGVVESWICSSD